MQPQHQVHVQLDTLDLIEAGKIERARNFEPLRIDRYNCAYKQRIGLGMIAVYISYCNFLRMIMAVQASKS